MILLFVSSSFRRYAAGRTHSALQGDSAPSTCHAARLCHSGGNRKVRAMDRRRFITSWGAFAASFAIGGPFGRAAAGYPFSLRVASGQPSPDGFALWTRLALEPLAPDGLGGSRRPSDGRSPPTTACATSSEWVWQRWIAVGRIPPMSRSQDSNPAVHTGIDSRHWANRVRLASRAPPRPRTRSSPACGLHLPPARIGKRDISLRSSHAHYPEWPSLGIDLRVVSGARSRG